MALLEIVVICVLTWGGVAGYLSGWKRTVYYSAAFLATTAAATAFKADLIALVSRKIAIKDHVAVIIDRKLAVPVNAAFSNVETATIDLDIPKTILSGFPMTASADLSNLVDLMAQVTTNAISFFVLLIMWIGLFNLFVLIRSGNYTPKRSLERWTGVPLGVLRHALLIIIIIGTGAPLIWLIGLPGALFDFENSLLLRWCIQLGQASGIWW